MIKQKNLNNINSLTPKDRVEITFYTDPLCCWSWALLPELLKVKANFNDSVCLNYCMGGLIKDWNSFSDPINNVNQPSQMGPIWLDASQKTGIDFNDSLWVNDPPHSSYPSCIAVKTAELQSPDAGAAFFEMLAETAMLEGKNISKPEVLVYVAQKLEAKLPDVFNLTHFIHNYNNEQSRDAFKSDLQKVKFNQIGRFPTVTLSFNKKTIVFTGYRPYDVILDALSDIAPAII